MDEFDVRSLFRGTVMAAKSSDSTKAKVDVEVLPDVAMKSLPEDAPINRERGLESGISVYWIDGGIGAAPVDDLSSFLSIAEDLLKVMRQQHLQSGALLLSSRLASVAPGAIDDLAKVGISVRASQGKDLIGATRRLLASMWEQQRAVREHLRFI